MLYFASTESKDIIIAKAVVIAALPFTNIYDGYA